MELRFELEEIQELSQRYTYKISDAEVVDLRSEIEQQGFITKEQLGKIAYWKAPRSAGHVRKNSDDYIHEITRFALTTISERARIQALTVLDGVSWPTASVILHLFHKDPYPILDFRALWSVSAEQPSQYTFDFWWEYVQFCRSLADLARVSMRTLDRALWQYSKEETG
jgi:hypothetical protein